IVVRSGAGGAGVKERSVAIAGGAAQITTTAASRIEHRVVATPTGVDEIVRVLDGTVRLTVEDVRTGDHVRVRTRDAEVEGAGDYEVTVASESLSSVTVRHGTAEIRVDGQRAVFLSAGQTWRAAAILTADLPLSSPSTPPAVRASDKPDVPRPIPSEPGPAPSRTPDPAVRTPDTAARTNAATRTEAARNDVARTDAAAPAARTEAARHDVARAGAARTPDAAQVDAARTPDAARTDEAARRTAVDVARTDEARTNAEAPAIAAGRGAASSVLQPKGKREIERRFEAGWKLLREGKAAEAAAELGAAAEASPDDALAVDARYFQAVALVRAGKGREAETVLVAFLDRAGLQSLRRGRAAVLLGRLLAERGAADAARAWYRSAVDDPDAGVAAAARAGLEALPPRR
ncbi:MAG: hypothetical protein KIT31_24830, partial [Deltaproteobacteria bacterium]|nr:hypothetical protein [Deltaproteobacteria bacterium]